MLWVELYNASFGYWTESFGFPKWLSSGVDKMSYLPLDGFSRSNQFILQLFPNILPNKYSVRPSATGTALTISDLGGPTNVYLFPDSPGPVIDERGT